MFTCQQCGKTSEPKVSPVNVVTQTRPVSYVNEFEREDENGRVHKHVTESVGWEIVKEHKVCPTCAEPFGIVNVPRRSAPAPVNTFHEKEPDAFTQPLIASVVQRLLDRLQHREKGYKRATRDCELAVPLIKGFVDANKEYVF